MSAKESPKSETKPNVAPPAFCGGSEAYGGVQPPVLMFALETSANGTVERAELWCRVLTKTERRWGVVPRGRPALDAALVGMAQASAKAQAAKGPTWVSRRGRSVKLAAVLVSPSGRVRVDGQVPGGKPEHVYGAGQLSPDQAKAAYALWRERLPVGGQAPTPPAKP